MKKAYVITEGESDVAILKKLLPARLLKNISIVAGQGDYGARSLAGSILSVRHTPVALVIDADTTDGPTIRERENFARWSLDQSTVNTPFEVFLAVPSLPSVFFQDKSLIENFAHKQFTELEWKLLKLQPLELFGDQPDDKVKGVQKLLKTLNQDSIKTLQTHKLINSLTEFLTTVTQNGQALAN